MAEAASSLQQPFNGYPVPARLKAEKWAVGGFALLVWILIALSSCCWNRTPAFDEIGLHNAVYMYLHYGKMTFPAHEHFDNMVVHPPVLYAIIAWLMKLGLPLFHAAGLPLCVLSLVSLLLIWRGPFPAPVQLGMIAGLFLAAFIWNSAFLWSRLITLRPDLHLAMAWFTGLVALESSRLDRWKPGRTLLGGFLLACASGIHYIGAASWLGLLVYGLWSWRDLGWKGATKVLLLMAVGASLFALPYLYFWVIPSWKSILWMTREVQGEGGIAKAWSAYWQAYENWKAAYQQGWDYSPITIALTKPLISLGVPAAGAAAVLLLLVPSTRALALAGLPHLLFILLYVRGGLKASSYTGYYVPEFILYLCGLLSLALTLLNGLLRKVMPNLCHALVIPVLASGLAVGILFDFVCTGFRFTHRRDDVDLARAAGREILGPEARVGVVSAGPWYTCGAADLCYIKQDFLYPQDISALDLKDYFGRFDALILYPHMSEVTSNRQRKALSSCYADGTLNLQGFYFSERRIWHECDMAYLALSVGKRLQKSGFGYRHGRLYRFDEHPEGQDVFACYTCPVSELSNQSLGYLDFYVTFRLPAQDPQQAPDRMLCVFIMPRQRYEEMKPGLLSKGQLREEFFVRRSRMDTRKMLHHLRRDDKPLQFFPSLAQMELVANTGRELLVRFDETRHSGVLKLGTSPNKPSPLPLEKWQVVSPPEGAKMEALPGGMQVTTPSYRWAYALTYVPLAVAETGVYRLHLKYKLATGNLAFGALSADRSRWIGQAGPGIAAADAQEANVYVKTFELPLHAGESFQLLISNDYPGGDGSSQFELKEIQAHFVRRPKS